MHTQTSVNIELTPPEVIQLKTSMYEGLPSLHFIVGKYKASYFIFEGKVWTLHFDLSFGLETSHHLV